MNIYSYLQQEYDINFDQNQQQALDLSSGKGLLLAVPGAGKTTVLVSRIFKMISQDSISPQSILSLTFSRASARDMGERYKKLYGKAGFQTPHFSTLHSFCYGVLGEYARIKQSTVPTLIDGTKHSSNQIIRQIYIEKINQHPDDDTVEELSRTIGYLKNMQLTVEAARNMKFDTDNIAEIYEGYERYKKQNKLMDYDDMLSYCKTVFTKHKDILRLYQARYRHILVDEAQDISPLGYAVIEQISSDAASLLYVGDEDQSIYAFRGASPDYLVNLPQKFPGVTVVKAEQSFRCNSTVTALANRIISRNTNRYNKKILPFFEGNAQSVQIVELPELEQQSVRLLELMEAVPPDKTIGVLYRNNASAIAIVELLEEKNRSFHIKEFTSKFSRQAVVLDILAILRLAQCPHDIESFKRVYYKLGAYISKPMMEYACLHTKEGDNLFDVLSGMGEKSNNSSRVLYLKYRLQGFSKMTPKKMIDTALYDFGLFEFMEGKSSIGYTLESAMQKINALKTIATRSTNFAELEQKIEQIDRSIALHSTSKERNQVTLSTIHSAKGMEFDVVFIVDVLEGIIPSATAVLQSQKEGNKAALEEEVRIFYVGITRAKEQLFILYANQLDQTALRRSSFLDEPGKQAKTSTKKRLEGAVTFGEYTEGMSILGRTVNHSFMGKGVVVGEDADKKNFVVEFKKGKQNISVMTFLSGLARLI